MKYCVHHADIEGLYLAGSFVDDDNYKVPLWTYDLNHKSTFESPEDASNCLRSFYARDTTLLALILIEDDPPIEYIAKT